MRTSGARWIPIVREGRPAGYAVIDDGVRPRRVRYVAHALPAAIPRDISREPGGRPVPNPGR